jgi:FAD/FMN-containing dehydrogenase
MQTQIPIDDLRAALPGRVLGPGDDGYDAARGLFAGQLDHRPDAIVRAAGAEDVAAAVVAARDAGLPLAVKSGGHSPAGLSVSEGGLTLDLSGLGGFELDADGRSAWAGPGLTTGAYTTAAAEAGLATGFGDTPSVGVGGITLAGGIGFLVRAHGMTIDQLLEAEVVTGDGEIVRTDAEHEPDLFWAIRGGGGNVAVATRLRFRLHELPAVNGGILVLPATPETIAGFIATAEAAPDELSTIANVMTAPPMPFLPEELVGTPVLLAFMLYAGDPEAGQAVLAPFRALATPIADFLRPMTYPELFMPQEEGYRPVAVSRTSLTDRPLDDAAGAAILEHLAGSTAMMRAAQLRPLGGAMARVPADATAFAHRRKRYMVTVAAMVERADQLPDQEPWAEGLLHALAGEDAAAYVGFLADEGEARVHAAFPGPTWERLASIKARFDPSNVLRGNQNVPPAS